MTSGLHRTIGLLALVTLLALGVGYILEKPTTGTPALGAPAAAQPARPGDAAKPAPVDATDDRSDLILIQG
jgi:hypothetical protein